MNIDEFCGRYSISPHKLQSIENLSKKWALQKQLDDLLATPIAGTVVLGDILAGDGLGDHISHETFNAFKNLMGRKADTYREVRNILNDKIERGEESVNGLINKIKGQIGENIFQEQMGDIASLAPSGSLEAWDIALMHPDGTQYVQVKLYSDPRGVINHIMEVQEKLHSKTITGIEGDEIVKNIDFAVPHNILPEVKDRIEDLQLDVKVIPVDITASDAADIVRESIENVGSAGLESFFTELFGTTLTATVLQGAVNGFLLYKGAKEYEKAIEDTIYSSAITAGGVATALLLENALREAAFVANPVIGATTLLTSIAVRMYLKRIADRRCFNDWLVESNRDLQQTIGSIQPI